MDLQCSYNNVRVKERNKYKVAFTTYVGSFEPVIIFFRMTNFPAMFQTLMNELLRNIINKRKVVAFVDNVLRL